MPDAPRERSLSNVNFVSVNKASASEARKEIVRYGAPRMYVIFDENIVATVRSFALICSSLLLLCSRWR